MSTGQAIAIVGIFLMVDLVVVGSVIAMVVVSLKEFANAFPATPPKPGAVLRKRQSVSIGILNLGWSVALTADDEGLHFGPPWLLRKMGVPSATVPWDAMRRTTKPGYRWYCGVKAGAFSLKLPRWCEPFVREA
jgi:hypothetical protein